MSQSRDVTILRDLAQRYADACAHPLQDERRDLWRRHNSLQPTRPPIHVRWLAAWHEHPESKLQCEEPFYQHHERFLRQMLVQDTLGDDYVLEPWITCRASVVTPPGGPWGISNRRIMPQVAGGAWQNQPAIVEPDDVAKLVAPHHVIDEARTATNLARLQDAVGDLLTVDLDRSPAYQVWHGDLSTDLGYLRGIQEFMLDMYDRPAWLHDLLAFLRDGVVRAHDEAEAAGDWSLSSHQNQAEPYSLELPDPAPNSGPVRREQLWVFVAAQEYTLVSPALHEEFLLQYQLPIISRFGLAAYGCCEDLTKKIDLLRQVPNLRRIAVTPSARIAECAERIGSDYVLSWRPNPTAMICCGFHPEQIRQVIREGLLACRANGCRVDLTLKDVQTVGGRPEDLLEWTRIVREVCDEVEATPSPV